MSECNACTCGSAGTCGACRGIHDATPVEIANRPGLSSIRVRVGDHARFKSSLLAGLSRARLPALRGLTTRADDDFSIALLDAFAAMADILTFYQERLSQEAYLRTAVERLSMGYLAKLIGYELRPGSAANVTLAFQMTEGTGAPKTLKLAVGTRVQSTPGADESPQSFETIEELEIRPIWNAIPAKATIDQVLSADVTDVYLAGGALNLRRGEGFLIVFKVAGATEYTASFRRAARIEHDPKGQWTHVIFTEPDGATATFPSAKLSQRGVFVFRTKAALFGHNAPDYFESHKNDKTGTYTKDQDWFGANANPIDEEKNPNDAKHVVLDQAYREIVPRSWAVWRYAPQPLNPGDPEPTPDYRIFRIKSAPERGYSLFGLSGKVTQLEADEPLPPSLEPADMDTLRSVAIYAESEKIDLAILPLLTSVHGDTLTFDRRVRWLEAERRISVSGKVLKAEVRNPVTLEVTTEAGLVQVALMKGDTLDLSEFQTTDDETGLVTWKGTWEGSPAQMTVEPQDVERSDEDGWELSTILEVAEDGRSITLSEPLQAWYDPPTVRISVNVVQATHGESVKEFFDGGDAIQVFQKFQLKQPPITYVSATTPSGTESTLQVFVNDLEWHEVPYFYGQGPEDHVFTTRVDGEGNTWIQFGNGWTGSRLPTGARNVRAQYRRGIGQAGNLEAGQINLLVSRPLGLKDVSNPLESSDGKDAESIKDARRNAPLTVRTLDRVVSLSDYRDFAQAFAGVVKAIATWSWLGETRGIYITVAGGEGGEISQEGRQALVSALAEWGDPHVPVRVENYESVLVKTGLRVKIDPDRIAKKVLKAVDAALRDAFSFDRRELGDPLQMTAVSAVAQAVPGVLAVQVTSLHRSDDPDLDAGLVLRILARLPQPGGRGEILPAELLTLDPGRLELLEAMP